MKTIEITIDNKGAARVQTQGFTGSSCRQASGFIEEALGQMVSEQMTGEFYEAQTTSQSQQAHDQQGHDQQVHD